ncbi:MAG: methyltransferase domain-containing protein [Deltaproteobacteria bacterium]|nr:methyltransferase domain-containing protein [Deltaproteobacteria bacterium]
MHGQKGFRRRHALEAFPYSEEFKNLTLESLRNREGRPEHEYWFRMAMTRVDFQRRYFMPALEFFVGCADKDVLELGCGTGPASVAMAEHGARVTAIDIDPKMIHAATLRVRDHGQSDRVRVVSMVLNDGDGMAPGRLASNYFGFGDAIYGTGRMHARLFTNHGMDSSWRSVQEIIPALQTNQSVHLNLNSYSILGVDVRLPIPEEVRLMKILVYWDEPYYSSNIANVQAVLRRTLGTNCNATYWPVASQTSNNEGGNWLHFVLDSSQSVGGGGRDPISRRWWRSGATNSISTA